jgi:transcriptional regulator with XRE-family HTH domain
MRFAFFEVVPQTNCVVRAISRGAVDSSPQGDDGDALALADGDRQEFSVDMKTFGQVIMEARKKAGLTQKEVAERLRREDGRKVLPPYLNDLEHDRRYPPENSVIDQLAKILGVAADVLYFHANRLSDDLNRAADGADVQAAFRAFRKALGTRRTGIKPAYCG